MCRKQARKEESISGSAAAAASGVGAQDADGQDSFADVNSDDSDADEDMSDYVDGVLLEALTSAFSVNSSCRRLIGCRLMGSSGCQTQIGDI